MSALTGQPRSAMIRAASALSAIEIDKTQLQMLFELDPGLMERISRVVAERNAQREALLQGVPTPPPNSAEQHHQTLLGKMKRFFGRVLQG